MSAPDGDACDDHPRPPAGAVAEALDSYLRALRERLLAELGGDLEALLITGSAAGGDLAPASDVDAIAISRARCDEATLLALARRLSHRELPCPLRKLELVLYAREALAAPEPTPRFQLNLNTGARMTDHVGLRPDDEPRHWFLLDLAIARELGRSLHGPAPVDVLPAPPRAWLLEAALDGLEWALSNEPASASTVLSACRARRYAEEDRWSTKTAAGAWAVGRSSEPGTIRAALEVRAGQSTGRLAASRVRRVVEEARAALVGAR